ncbi:MAG: transglutaminaseTgpA domain-containing protein [Propionibacteriaceae bacterium]|jgi:transglutaminase-like putative cysteine protease|nr:transglutaminaseTgpA domain-containing protein [Propionibacteriaceae bacterium]
MLGALAASGALMPTTQDRGWLPLTAILVGLSGLSAIALRGFQANEWVVKAVQLLPGAAFWTLAVGDQTEPLISETMAYAAVMAAPMPTHLGYRYCAAMALWALYLLVDWLAVGLEQPAWTFPLVFAPHLAAALGMVDEVPALDACFGAVGYGLVLTFAALARRRGLRPQLAALVGGAATTAVALAAALWLGQAVPDAAVGLQWSNRPEVTLSDPSLDLRRNLKLPAESEVLRYRVDDGGDGVYLRLAALTALDANGFSLVRTNLYPLDDGSPHPRAYPPGAAVRETRVSVEIGSFASEWVPLPWQTAKFSAPGEWSYDPPTQAVTTIEEGRANATRDLEYSASAQVLQTPDSFWDGLRAGDPRDSGQTAYLPPNFGANLQQLADSVAAGADSDGAKAKALLDFFHSGRFHYSLDGSTDDAWSTMRDFLLVSHTGYCEQFAAGLAILARAEGIPSRVAIGFLPGTADADGYYRVTTHQMHAWTELYFADYGWVALDPTPPTAVGRQQASTAAASPTPSPSATPKPSASARPTASGSTTAGPKGGKTAAPVDLRGWLAGAGGVLLAALLAALPRLLRSIRAKRRLSTSPKRSVQAENAWLELRDRVVDAGAPWPDGTPRQTAEALAGGLFSEPSSGAAARRLAVLVERARFAPDMPPDSPQELLAQLRPKAKHPWLPRSVFTRRR